MKKWLRNITMGLSMTCMLGLTACAYTPGEGQNGSPIVSPFGKVALMEYVDNATKFVDYDNATHEYSKIVDRQLTAMAEDIAGRLYTIYGGGTSGDSIVIQNSANPTSVPFLTTNIAQVVTGDVPVKVTLADGENIYATSDTLNSISTTSPIYYDLEKVEMGEHDLGYIQAKELGLITNDNAYKKYNHYYFVDTESQSYLKPNYGVVFEANQASLFDNLSNLLYTMNEINGQGTIEYTPHEKDDDPYSLANVLNFKDSMNGGPRWAVVAKLVKEDNPDDPDDRSKDYYKFQFLYNKNNHKTKAEFEREIKNNIPDFDTTNDHIIIIEQPAWEITKSATITDIEALTTILKKYLASIIASGGNSDIYLAEDVTSATSDDVYISRTQNINYTANWLDLYFTEILDVIKTNIIGKELWNTDLGYGEYLQGLSDDCYKVTNEKLLPDYEDYFNNDRVPVFLYNIEDSPYVSDYLMVIEHKQENESKDWKFIDLFLTEYLNARNYQGYDLLVSTLLRSCADHMVTSGEDETLEKSSRWFVSSKSGISVYDSPDDYAGDKVEIKPAKQYKSVLFFAKEATDLTEYSIMVFFGNVQQSFAVRPIITLVNGNGQEKEITILTTDDYTLSATTDKEYVDGNKETGKYIVRADNEYTGYDEASFIIEFNKGSIVGEGSYTSTPEPTIADNDWVLQSSYTNGKLTSVDTILDAYNYIQISFEQFDLSGNPVSSNIPFGFIITITN